MRFIRFFEHRYLIADARLECGSAEHISLFAVSVFGCLVYVVGVIVLFVYIMRLVHQRRPRSKSGLAVITRDGEGVGREGREGGGPRRRNHQGSSSSPRRRPGRGGGGGGARGGGDGDRVDILGTPVDIDEEEMRIGSGKLVLPPVMWATRYESYI